jgi:ribonucleoside-diphosphate reductase alpha chain
MDCDTTGVEPDYALVKFKKLIGGGYFKIINQSVPRALKNLGYTKAQVDEIIKYIVGTATFESAPHINREELAKKGLSDHEIDKAESRLVGAFDLNQAFQDKKLTDFGFSLEQIQEASNYICGKLTIEGAPDIQEEHLPVFDCASKCGQYGKRYIEPMGHIKMMALIQPFLSGAISKTVNMPNEASVSEIAEVYHKAWEYGLKAIAIYRDGSKLAQPLNTKTDSDKTQGKKQQDVVIEYRPVRRKLAKQRASITRKVIIGGHKMFLTVGLYEDGKPGELFIVMNQQGSFAAGMADSFAKMVSIGLQYGVPIETIVSQLRHMRFQPMGFTGDSDVSNASSISDFIAQWFDKMFLGDGLKAMRLPFNENNNKDGGDATAISNTPEEDDQIESTPPPNLFTESLGFSGEMCPECGMASMVQNGKCLKCVNCGATTGCS